MTVTSLRTCVGCGTRAPRATLLRFVLDDDRGLRLDPRKCLPGRGAWLHAVEACGRAFAERRGSVRSLRAAPSRAARLAVAAAVADRVRQGTRRT